MKNMNLNQLRYFICLAETLSFTKAAQACFISQTAMTQQIQNLERTVGTALLKRDKHHVELTAAGRVYLNEARLIVSKSNEAIKLARLASEGVEGELRLGYASGLGQSDLIFQLQNFHRMYPAIKMSFFADSTSALFNCLERNDCDIIFTVSPRIREYPGMKHQYLKSCQVMAVVPAGHSLSGKTSLTYKELENEQFIMMEPSDRPKDQMEESVLIYERGGFYPNITAMEKNPETLMLMISVGMGISILPEYIVKPYQEDQNMKIIPMIKEDGSMESIDLEADWMSENMNPVLEHLLNIMKL